MPLSVPVQSGGGVTLQNCIKKLVEEEVLDERWYAPKPHFPGRATDTDFPKRLCPKCKIPQWATKTLTLSRLPPILVIHLERFSFKSGQSAKVRKILFLLIVQRGPNNLPLQIDTKVRYPLLGLDLTDYMVAAPHRYVYDLYAVTIHRGKTLDSGH